MNDEKILFSTSLSPGFSDLLLRSIKLAKSFNTNLEIFHVKSLNDTRSISEIVDHINIQVQELLPPFYRHIPLEVTVEEGEYNEAIKLKITAKEYLFVVMGLPGLINSNFNELSDLVDCLGPDSPHLLLFNNLNTEIAYRALHFTLTFTYDDLRVITILNHLGTAIEIDYVFHYMHDDDHKNLKNVKLLMGFLGDKLFHNSNHLDFKQHDTETFGIALKPDDIQVVLKSQLDNNYSLSDNAILIVN